MSIDNIISEKSTVKTLEFILAMAKDSYNRQEKETGLLTTKVICQHYQQININESQKIIDAIIEYQEYKKNSKEKYELPRDN